MHGLKWPINSARIVQEDAHTYKVPYGRYTGDWKEWLSERVPSRLQPPTQIAGLPRIPSGTAVVAALQVRGHMRATICR